MKSIKIRIKDVGRKILVKIISFKYGRMDRKQTFEHIYDRKLWGRKRIGTLLPGIEDFFFYSGEGSHKEQYVEPYCMLIKKFVHKNKIKKVCDLGCGDFNVASKWIDESIEYEGVDIVQKMIDHHTRKYGADNIHFHCLDIVEDDLPDADLCLVRQVLQHLSNEEIKRFLSKIQKYKYVIVTEHITKKKYAYKYNVDQVHSFRTRIDNQSGIYLDEEPFNMKVQTLLEISGDAKNDVLVSVLIVN